jgi:DNA-binding MarR family transcriptional regulator
MPQQQQIQPTSFGHTVALAQRALTGALRVALVDAGATLDTWYGLNTLAVRGPVLSAATLRAELAQAPDGDAARAEATIRRLVDEGLAYAPAGLGAPDTDGLELTPGGAALHQRLRDATRAVSRELLAPFDEDELERAERLLRAVTQRALEWQEG